jgi:plasmid maintenance system antidote protein VapI
MLAARKLTGTAFAAAAGMPAPVLRRILRGEGYVYAETAIRFALVTGTAPEYWLNLQLSRWTFGMPTSGCSPPDRCPSCYGTLPDR